MRFKHTWKKTIIAQQQYCRKGRWCSRSVGLPVKDDGLNTKRSATRSEDARRQRMGTKNIE